MMNRFSSGTTHWRPIPEKRPDFSKIKKGGLVFIECFVIGDSKIGFIKKIGNKYIDTICLKRDDARRIYKTKINQIKKITRINVEERTFEEIWSCLLLQKKAMAEFMLEIKKK